jgi:cytoskeleton protein RodZ
VSDAESLDMSDQHQLDGQLPGFPGYLLRQAREGKGWSQMETARELHLTSKVINAIEEDDFELIPSFVFARGYIRSYARHVGLDGQALVAEFDSVYGVPDHGSKPMVGIRNAGEQSKPSDTWVKVVSALFVIGLVVVSIMWWQSQNGGLAISQLTSVTVDTAQGETLVEPAEELEDNLDLATLTASQAEVGAVPLIEASQAPAAVEVAPVVIEASEQSAAADVAEPVPAPVAQEAPVLAANEAVLVMVFEKDCWVEVKDGNGKMILSDLFSADERIDQVVIAPIGVLLGRSSAVTHMTFDERIIDLKPHTRKDIARLTLKK